MTTVHHTSYAALFTKRILVVLAHCDGSPAIREWSRYSATIATAKRRGRERSAMKLDDDAFSFDIMGPPELDFGTCEYLGSCEYLRVCIVIRKRDFVFSETRKDCTKRCFGIPSTVKDALWAHYASGITRYG